MRASVTHQRKLLATLIALPLSTLSALVVAPSAIAQTETAMEEVIVSARRREENLQEVPISINAFSEDTLREFNAVALEDIAELTPGMQFRQIGGTPEVVMRGLAQTDQIGLQSNVGVFIDGIFLNNRSTIEFNNMDLKRVEVLKGPQSALFGRNTFAGAINYVTNEAVLGEFDGSIDLEYGSDDRMGARGSLNIPLGENAAIRLFGGTSEWDGSIDNARGGDNVGGWEDRTTYGFSALFDYERVRLKVFYTDNESEDDTHALNLSSFELNDGGTLYRVPDGNGGTADYWTVLTGELKPPSEISIDSRARGNKGDMWLAYANLDIDLGFSTLTLNASQSESQYSSFLDNIGNPDAVNQLFFPPNYTRQFFTDLTGDLGEQDTYEIRLTSNADAAFEWLVGWSRFESTTGGVLGTTTTLLGQPEELERITNVEERLLQDIDAFFGAVNFPITEQLNVTGELRYTQEDQTLTDLAEIFFLPFLSRPLTTTDADFDFWSGRIGLDYTIDDNTMVYGYAARGVKSGGINGTSLDPDNPFRIFDPENNWTYELGIKTDILDGRGVINAAVYYIDWTDLQSTAPADLAVGPLTVNGSGAESMGIEVDGTFFLTDNFTLRVATTYIDATYDDDFVDAAVQARCGVNNSPLEPVSACSPATGGNTIANTSDFQFFGSGVYTWPEAVRDFDAYARASYSFEAGRHPESLNLAQTEDVSLVNLRVGLRNEQTEIALWMDNAFDEEYLARATRVTEGAANVVCPSCGISSMQLIRANGRSWGLRVKYDF